MGTFVKTALNFIMFLGFWFYYRHFTDVVLPPAWHMLGLLPILVFCAVMGMGMGLLLSSMTIKYRDISFFLPFFAQLWMYASPVIYPASTVQVSWRWIILFNPMSWALEATRRCLVGQGTFDGTQIAGSVMAAMIMLIAGVMIFNRAQRTFVDIV